MNVKLEGFSELNKILIVLPKVATEAAMAELERVGNDLQAKASQLAPVDTGDLRGSGFTETDGKNVTVGFESEYALKQHENLNYRHPKGGEAKYLETPYKENLKKYVGAVGDAIRKAVEFWR